MTVPAIQPVPLVLTVKDAAEVLRCKMSTVERYIDSHELAVIHIGRERRIRGEDLIDFIVSRPITNGGRR